MSKIIALLRVLRASVVQSSGALNTDSFLMHLEPLRRHLAVWQAAWSLEKLRPRLLPRTADELAFLPAAIEIIETPASPLGRLTGFIVVALFASTLTWACLGHVDIHATAQGRIIPGGMTKPVAALEAATVAAIHVADGDHVAQGQALIDLDPAAPGADVTRLRREWQEQAVTALRLHALLDGRDDFGLSPEGRDEKAALSTLPPDLVALNRQELRQELGNHHATIEALRQELNLKQAEKRGTESDRIRLEKTVPLLEERQRTKGQLAEDGYVSRTEYLQVKQDYIDRLQELDSTRHKLIEDDAAIANAEQRLAEAEAQFRSDNLGKLADAEQKAASLSQDLAKAEDRRRLYQLTAPVAGVVQQLAVHAPGAVVSQAQPLLMIVPQDEGIAVQAALPNKDAGFVLPGQAVEIKVEAFPFTRYGTIAGTVMTVSGDAVQGPDSDPTQRRQSNLAGNLGQSELQAPNYSVQIALAKNSIRADGREVALTPGMAVTTEIKTGKRRVIEYVLDPMLRYRDESLRER